MNGLGVARPFEQGPVGDVYSWFYDYSPDLDQFVTSNLLSGFYPAEYLKANLDFLKANVGLAVKHRLVPGLHINSPRSMPEQFWTKYPFLRGARVDHPRESFLPRYTLAMAHPAVQQHYRELLRNLLREVPQLGFIHVWTNDSGSGFEYVTSLYAGRNGGPYLLREWKGNEEIARKAAENVLTYYHLLRDEGKKVNSEFRVVCDLGSFYAERKHIIPGLGEGLDVGAFGSFEGTVGREEEQLIQKTGAVIHEKLEIGENNVLGVPFPWLVHERLREAAGRGVQWLLTSTTPHSLAPYDINGQVLRSFQQNRDVSLHNVLTDAAEHWVGPPYVEDLIALWKLADTAVRAYPAGIPFSTFAFPWFRLWIRPFVPNIDAIAESERAYYERYLLATFNNPARIDLNNDMMWNFLTVPEAREKKEAIDRDVLPPLAEAIARGGELLGTILPANPARTVFQDLHDRLRAARCYYCTMRNSVAWTEAVHGYCEAASEDERRSFRSQCRAMILNELENMKALLALWNESNVEWMPVSETDESLHIYAENFGEHLKRKIALMEAHANDEPWIDKTYMWRMPAKDVRE